MVRRSSTPISADRVTTTEENAVLTHPMLDQLSQLGLSGMAQAFAELRRSSRPLRRCESPLRHRGWFRSGCLTSLSGRPCPCQVSSNKAPGRQTSAVAINSQRTGIEITDLLPGAAFRLQPRINYGTASLGERSVSLSRISEAPS